MASSHVVPYIFNFNDTFTTTYNLLADVIDYYINS